MTYLFIWIWWFFWAILRALITKWSAIWFGTNFHYGTLIVNVLWSFIIGVFFALFENIEVDIKYKSLLTTWFLWALTTFSTFAMESFFILDRWNYTKFILNISLNLFLTIIFAWIGFYLVSYLFKKYAK